MIQVLIADDEEVECAALERMLTVHFPQVQVLPSVYNGYTLVQMVEEKRPEIVIVDINMPGMGGLEALKVLCDRSFQPAVIIHTAYNNFEYIRTALLMGAKNYLVKPVFEADFVVAFSKVYTAVLQKKEMEAAMTPGTMMGRISYVTEKNIMMSLLLGTPDSAAWALYKPTMQIGTNGMGACAIRLSDGKDIAALSSEFLFELRQKCKCMSIVHQETLYCLLILQSPYDRNNYKQWVRKTLGEALQTFCRRKRLVFHAGCSDRRDEIEGLARAVREAEAALDASAENHICFESDLEEKIKNPFSGYAEILADSIREGRSPFVGEVSVWKKICAAIQENAASGAAGFFVCVCAQKMIIRSAEFLHMDARLLGMDWTLQERLRNMIAEILRDREQGEDVAQGNVELLKAGMSAEHLRQYIEREIKQLERDSRETERKPNSYVEAAITYIREHYNEPISLQTVAEEAGITQFYLSRLLKQEKDQTFPDLLTELRLGRAIALMNRKDMNIQTIGESVGYTAKYFTQLFRATFGVSVREFRGALLETCP